MPLREGPPRNFAHGDCMLHWQSVPKDPQHSALRVSMESFVRDFFGKGELMIRELIEDNERLRARVALGDTGDSPGRPASLHEFVDRVAALESDCREVRQLAGNLERESGGFRERLTDLENDHYQLACQHVAANQFYRAATLEEVLRTLRDVLVNFLGIEAFTAYVLDEEQRVLFPIANATGHAVGGEPIVIDGHPTLAALADAGRPWRVGDPDYATATEMMILPLVSGTRLLGAVRLERFLPQKPGFAETDAALLSLVSEYAGIGIECAWTRANAQDRPLGRATVESLVGA